MPSSDSNLISDILTALKVPFTSTYTNQRFEGMPFKTLFGVCQLLKEYGVEAEGYKLPDKSDIKDLKSPFLAQTKGGLVLVNGISSGKVNYLSQGVREVIPEKDFLQVFTGVVMVFTIEKGAKEPEFGSHLTIELISKAKTYVLIALVGCLVAYLLVTNGTWRYWSVWALIAVDGFGIWLTYMLVQKSLSIKNRVADKVCGVLQEGGCDSILKTSASSFFGIFSWSEVGFTYFGVSMLAMLISPLTIHWLAIINICCLPFTVWSIWYQKFRAKHWCTLCVSVQLSLWLQFICYFFGRWQAPIFPWNLGFFALCATFIAVLLALNKILPNFSNKSE